MQYTNDPEACVRGVELVEVLLTTSAKSQLPHNLLSTLRMGNGSAGLAMLESTRG